MRKLMCILGCLVMTSCTQTMTMVHTQGYADDVVDEISTASPDVKPVITVPISALPGGVSLPSIPVTPVVK